jgi:hypothetical protein
MYDLKFSKRVSAILVTAVCRNDYLLIFTKRSITAIIRQVAEGQEIIRYQPAIHA